MFKKNIKNNFWQGFFSVLFLLVLFLLLFWKLIFKPGYISFGDNTYLFENLYISAWLPHESNGVLGSMMISMYTSKILFLKIFRYLGMGPTVISKLTYLLPIFLALLTSFIILRKISKSFLYATLGTTLFILSGISIEHMTVSFVDYFLHFASLLILTYLFYSWGFELKKLSYKRVFVLILLSFLNLHPFYFIIFNFYIFLYFVYAIFRNFQFSYIIKCIFIYICIFLINLFWLLPFLTSVFVNKVSPGGLYGESNWNAVLSGYISHSSLSKIITGSVYPISSYWDYLVNNNLIITAFILFSIFIYIVAHFFKEKNETGMFFSIVSIIFLSLSFWPNNPIIGPIWDYFLENYSFFGFFRSFNRFITVLLPVMFVVIGIYYKEHKNQIFKIILILISLLTLFGRRNLMTGDLGGVVPIYKIPTEYAELNEKLKIYKNEVGKTPRILIYPKTDYESFIWNTNSNYDHIRVGYFLLNNYLNAEILMSKYGNHVFISKDFFKNIFNYKYCLNEERYLEDLRKIDIDYILLNKDLITQKGTIIPFENYKNCLRNSNFSLEMKNNLFELYKINYGEKHIKNYLIKEISPFYYEVSLDFSGNKNIELVFPQNHNMGWKLYFSDGEKSTFFEKNAIPFYSNELVIENIDNEPGNKWVLNREDFKEDQINLHLYYYPQIYVFIGFIVSSFTLIVLILVWILLEIKGTRKHKSHHYA